MGADTDASTRRIADQIAYYEARAGEYDEWFMRRGRYDRGDAHRTAWFSELDEIRTDLIRTVHGMDVLELACGTGLWTQTLALKNAHVVAVDSSPAVIDINRARIGSHNVEYVEADLFSWKPARMFDAVFFAFWLSHVPEERFDAFWRTVRAAVRPGGVVFFADSLLEQTSTATNHDPLDNSGVASRKLNDGRTFEIVKVFYEPAALEARLHALGWEGTVRSTGRFFLVGALTAR